MLIELVVDLPSHSKVVVALRRRTDDYVAALLLLKILFCLRRVEVVEVGMLDDPTCPVDLRPLLARLHLAVAVRLRMVPELIVLDTTELAITGSNIGLPCGELNVESIVGKVHVHGDDDTGERLSRLAYRAALLPDVCEILPRDSAFDAGVKADSNEIVLDAYCLYRDDKTSTKGALGLSRKHGQDLPSSRLDERFAPVV